MAYATLFVTVLMMAAANARFKTVWEDDDDNSYKFPGMSYKYVTPLPLPQFPGFPNMNLPAPPPLLWPSNFPSPTYPTMPPMPKLPSVEDILNLQSQPGSNVVGGAVFSSSTASRGKDGEIIRKGGSTILSSNNGKVVVSQVGDAPPVKVYTNDNNAEPLSVSDTPKFNNFKPFTFQPINMDPFTMRPFHMDPITFKPIEPINVDGIRNYVPGNNENFSGSSHSVSSYSNSKDGKVSSGGASQSVQNDNGNVDESNIAFKSDPKD